MIRKIRLSRKYFRIRLSILLTAGFSIFLLWINFLGISELLLKQNDLNVEEGIISGVIYNSDITHRILRRDDVDVCLDIFVQDKDISVRLTDQSKSDLWKSLKDLKTVGKSIKFYYYNARLQKNYVYNPSHLIIDNQVVIDFETERKRSIPFLGLMLLFDLLVGSYLYIAIKTYNEQYKFADKILINEKKYMKFAQKWLTE